MKLSKCYQKVVYKIFDHSRYICDYFIEGKKICAGIIIGILILLYEIVLTFMG